MTDARIELPYRIRKWPTVCVLLLLAIGGVGAASVGTYLYVGSDIGGPQVFGALLRGKSGAAVLWCFAGIAAAVEILVIASWRQIALRQPRVLLEADAITVPSKWQMRPTRIAINTVTGVIWNKKRFGKVGFLWLHHRGGKAVIVEDLLEKGDAQSIVDWIKARQAMIGPGSM
jgi:hypothetical protein